jgi:hypothetical protein
MRESMDTDAIRLTKEGEVKLPNGMKVGARELTYLFDLAAAPEGHLHEMDKGTVVELLSKAIDYPTKRSLLATTAEYMSGVWDRRWGEYTVRATPIAMSEAFGTIARILKEDGPVISHTEEIKSLVEAIRDPEQKANMRKFANFIANLLFQDEAGILPNALRKDSPEGTIRLSLNKFN